MIFSPLGEYLTHVMASVCPIRSHDGAGQDDSFPLTILMHLTNLVSKVLDKVECEGKKGSVERYVCGALIETGV